MLCLGLQDEFCLAGCVCKIHLNTLNGTLWYLANDLIFHVKELPTDQ